MGKRRSRLYEKPEKHKETLVTFEHGPITGYVSFWLPPEGKWTFNSGIDGDFEEVGGPGSEDAAIEMVLERREGPLPTTESFVAVSVHDYDYNDEMDAEPAPELGNYSNGQLIAALVHRPSFSGAVIMGYPDEHRPEESDPQVVRCLTLDEAKTALLCKLCQEKLEASADHDHDDDHDRPWVHQWRRRVRTRMADLDMSADTLARLLESAGLLASVQDYLNGDATPDAGDASLICQALKMDSKLPG